MENKFEIVGIRRMAQTEGVGRKKRYRSGPVVAAAILLLIVAGCFACELLMTKDPAYLDLQNYSVPPCREFLFGTDTMGRDIYSMIWYGGRLSLFIGFASTLLSTVLAILIGAVSGCAPAWIDILVHHIAVNLSDASDRYSAQCARDLSRYSAPGSLGAGECIERFYSSGNYRMDEYCQGDQKRGAADQAQ